eukprot:307405_1
MSDASKHVSALWKLPAEDRDNGIKLLSQIFNKILSNPSEPKYSNLNLSKIRQKCDKCRPCIYLLFCAGFKESQDGSRLQWQYNNNNMSALKSVNTIIHSKPIIQPGNVKDKKGLRFLITGYIRICGVNDLHLLLMSLYRYCLSIIAQKESNIQILVNKKKK